MPSSRSHPASSAIPPPLPAARSCPPVQSAKASQDNCPPGSRVGDGYPAVLRPALHSVRLGAASLQHRPRLRLSRSVLFHTLHTPVILSAILHPRTEYYAITIGSLKDPHVRARGRRSPLLRRSRPARREGSEAASEVPFLSNPLDCSEADPPWKLTANSWQNPGAFLPGGLPDTSDPNWLTATTPAPPVTGCDDPALASQFDPTTIATKPLQGPARSRPIALRPRRRPRLPPVQRPDRPRKRRSMTPRSPRRPSPRTSPSSSRPAWRSRRHRPTASSACSDLASDPAGDQVHYDTTKPVTCPDSSKIGSATATSPLLATRDPVTRRGQRRGADPR